MSQRVKRPNRFEDGNVPVKRRKRTTAEEEEAASLAGGSWQPRSSDLKSIYNRTTTEAPAELFRKDLISAMKLPDSEPLASDEYWVIQDQWKQEWERGVQVPVNPDSLPEPLVTIYRSTSNIPHHEFKLPKNKYIRITEDKNFKPEEHVLSNAPVKSEAACSYDLDECDMAWLKILNSERALSGLGPVYEEQLERVIEGLELCCWDKIQSILRNEEGLGIEYDENVICDVCRSPDSEEGNEMVFCDSCNICVHQACYGITRIPEGQWLCCTCNIGKRPDCELCPNKGGAMKCLRTGQKWAHVSCALWIPEVSIGCVEKMEPITKVSSIPQSRWSLVCVLCRERLGACIQCSVKTCKTAYHVTCAFKHGLEMRAIIEDENADDGVKLRSYCEKHSKSSKKEKSICSGSGEDDECKRKKRKDMTSEEKNQARAMRLQEIEAEFFKHVTVKDISVHLDNDALQYIYNYWKLKRKAGFNKPLLPPKSEDVDMLSHKREQADLEKMKMFVQLRQDLERVRNLCYMVSRREKLSRTFFRMREQTFHKQAAVLESSHSLPSRVVEAVIEANHGPSIYDRLYSHNEAEDNSMDFKTILARIAGMKSPTNSGDESKNEINGLFKDVKNNPYKKVYFNGSSKRRSVSIYGSSMSSASSGDEKPKDNKENRLHSCSEEEKSSILDIPKRKASHKKNNISKAMERRRENKHISQNKFDSSSEEEDKPKKASQPNPKSRLRQMEKELGESCSDSDELMPISSSHKGDNHKNIKPIYSDTDSSDELTKNDGKSPNATSDSQSKLRTKASVKEFSQKPSPSKNSNKSPTEIKKNLKSKDVKKQISTKKKNYVPSDLIVPQRQAAKKATENLKTTTTSRAKELPVEEQTKVEEKIKQKPKVKPGKDIKETPKEEEKAKEKEVKEKEVREIKDKEPNKEIKEKKKESKQLPDVPEIDKEADKTETQELFAYVPQRQAAKKAAEHIKSGLGKPTNPSAEPPLQETEKMKKDVDIKIKKDGDQKKGELKKESEPAKPAKEIENKRKSSTASTSSSSSSSSTSSDSSSSSSSESEEEPVKAQPRSESPPLAREPTKRRTSKDWPFLDKGPRSAATSGSSSSSDSSAPSSPRKPSPPPSLPKADSPSRAATEPSTKPVRKSNDKKQSPPTDKREEQSKSRGRGRAPRGRPCASNSSDRVGDADVRPRDMSDGQRVSMETERGRGRSQRQASRDKMDNTVIEKETSESKLLSPVRKTDKKLKDSKETEVNNLDKEVLERKTVKDGCVRTKSSSTFDRLFGTSEDCKKDELETLEKSVKVEKGKKVEQVEEKFEKIVKSSMEKCDLTEKTEKARKEISKLVEKQAKPPDKPIIAPEKLKIPDKLPSEKIKPQIEKANKCLEKPKDSEKTVKPSNESVKCLEDVSIKKDASPKKLQSQSESPKTPIKLSSDSAEKTTKPFGKSAKSEQIIKSPNKELKEQVEKKTENKDDKKVITKKVPSKSKSIDDIFANKLSSSETKENKVEIKKPPTPKQPKPSDEITMADKILDDHLQIQKANDFYNRHSEEVFQSSSDISKTLNDIETEKKNSLKPPGLTNQVLQNRSIFSPQPHVKDATDFLDLVNFDDIGISKDDDIMKGPLTWNFVNSNIIRGDTKEDSARETLNLVEKLRVSLSKKSTGSEVDEPTTSNEIESDRIDFAEQVLASNPTQPADKDITQESQDLQTVNLQLKVQVTEVEQAKLFENINKQPDQPQQSEYAYLNNTPNMLLETQKSLTIQQHASLTDHTAPVEGDERWVPPSEIHSSLQTVDPTNYLNDSVPPLDSHYLNQYTTSASLQESQKKQTVLNTLPSQLDIRLHEEPLKNQSPSLQERIDRRISQTPLIDSASNDCMPSPMPYDRDKWDERQVMPKFRSSSSSASSSTSSDSRKADEDVKIHDVRTVNHSSLEMAYLPTQVPPFSSNPLDNFGGYPDGSCFPVSLFPPPNLNTQLPFPPAGPAAMFPPAFGAPFPTPHTIPSLPKPVEESIQLSSTCMAAFTTSKRNMEFTAAMVNLPTSTSKPIEQQLEEQLLAPPAELPACSQASLTPIPTSDEIVPSPIINNATPTENSTLPSPSTSLKSNSSTGKKSPSKPTRTSARVTSQLQNKSPAKSPGISPRQETALKQSGPGRGRGDNKRGSGKSGASRGSGTLRGRGRGRGKGSAAMIHNKFAGTVYDFKPDDDISDDIMSDLKSMRERRRSVDIHERKFEPFSSMRNSPRSPIFSSPSQTSHKTRCYNADLRDLRPPTPIEDSRSKTDISLASSDNEPSRIFPDVTPPLPGPVDMRTYNSNFDQQTYNEQNLLSAFASGTTETQVQDIDEDFEKELHSALTAKKPAEPPPAEASNNIKVSLSDSRNQLKVKIKGPIANYTSTVVPLRPPTVDPIVVSNVNSVTNNVMNSGSAGIPTGGPSSLRRMRKKELLRQYWTQDMNMDDPTSNSGYIATPAAQPINRTIITIPKAVASMTSIPTKDDYRDYRTEPDDFIESKHHRKESKAKPGSLSRELRQLELAPDSDIHLERRRSVGSAGSDNSGLLASFDSSLLNKRRGRPPRPSQIQVAPKLKIKIGNNTNSSIISESGTDDIKDRIRPPKKRLAATLIKPSLEDLKKESMKFRKKVRKDLKIKHKKKDKSEKRKKKKLKPDIQIITKQGENPTRLIIRFGKKSDSDNDKRTRGEISTSLVIKNDSKPEVKECAKEAPLSVASNSHKQFDSVQDDQPPPKLTPIRLKLSRCQEGSGYMMKPAIPSTEREKEVQSVEPGQPPPHHHPPPISLPEAVQHPPSSVPMNKDCEVR
nr:PHD finger protein rhinoceros [Leptinotarsa decemlineata]